MSSTGRDIFQIHHSSIHRHLTAGSSSIRHKKKFGTTSHGAKQTPKAHINNLYNTIFWALVQQGGETTTQAHAILRGTVSGTKNEMLHSRFGINYNTIPARYRKGSVLVQERSPPASSDDLASTAGETQGTPQQPEQAPSGSSRQKASKKAHALTKIELHHCDIIGDEFWDQRPYLLAE